MTDLLAEIAAGAARLDPRHPENGITSGRRGSTPAHGRTPVNLHAIALTDRRTGVVAVLNRWAQRVRVERDLPARASHAVDRNGRRWIVETPPTLQTESAVLAEHWEWAVAQPWGKEMVAALEELREQLDHGGRPVKVRICPVCGRPVRLDRLVAEHRACLMA